MLGLGRILNLNRLDSALNILEFSPLKPNLIFDAHKCCPSGFLDDFLNEMFLGFGKRTNETIFIYFSLSKNTSNRVTQWLKLKSTRSKLHTEKWFYLSQIPLQHTFAFVHCCCWLYVSAVCFTEFCFFKLDPVCPITFLPGRYGNDRSRYTRLSWVKLCEKAAWHAWFFLRETI